jgi:ABC-2 type transport system permease protein
MSDALRGGSAMRLKGLVRKEFLQIARDPSSIAIAFLMPLFLLVLFGFGVSLDADHLPIALVAEQPTADSADFLASLEGSHYFAARHAMTMMEAEQELREGSVNAIVHLRADFDAQLRHPDGAAIQLIVNGVDANTARLTEGYVEGAWVNWLARRAASLGQTMVPRCNWNSGFGITARKKAATFWCPDSWLSS